MHHYDMFTSSIHQRITQFATAKMPNNHNGNPTILLARPQPSSIPPTVGPMIRAALEMLDARPCTVPRRLLLGAESLTSIIVAGLTKVRDKTCKVSTADRQVQTRASLSGSRTRYGSKK